jgi:hypothetical protein
MIASSGAPNPVVELLREGCVNALAIPAMIGGGLKPEREA